MLDSDNLYCYLMKGLFELWQGNQIVQLPYLLYCGINNVVLCIKKKKKLWLHGYHQVATNYSYLHILLHICVIFTGTSIKKILNVTSNYVFITTMKVYFKMNTKPYMHPYSHR